MALNNLQILQTSDSGNGTENELTPLSRSPLRDAVYTVIACLAVLGNGMVIAVMLVRRRVFSSLTNRLILHQSVIDAITGVVFFLYKVIRSPTVLVSAEGNIYDQLICRLVASDFLLWCMNVTSTYSIVIISLERFMATCHPVRHRNKWSMAKLKFVFVTAYGLGIFTGTLATFMFEPYQEYCQRIKTGLALKVLLIALATGVSYFVPLTIMIYAYARILIMLRKKLAYPGKGRQIATCRAKMNVFVTILLIGIMFVVCWTPSEVLFVVNTVSNDAYTQLLYSAFTALLGCSLFVNPIIYCFKYEHFRSQLKDLVLRRLRRNKVNNREPISVT